MVEQIRLQRRILIALLAFFGCLFWYSVITFADYRIVDQADLFFSSEKQHIEQLAQAIDSNYKMNVLVLTDQQQDGKSSRTKADDAYEASGYADNDANGGICIIIDMANREVNLITDRKMIRFITDEREEKIYDVGYGYLSNAEYGDAMIAMLEKVTDYLEKGIPGNQYNYDPETGEISRYLSINAMDLGIAFGGAVLVPLFVVLIIASGYKKIAKYRYDLNANSKMKITASNDRFVKQYTTRRRIVSNSSGGGGGHSGGGRSTTHRSSSGRSFGGGHGRKF